MKIVYFAEWDAFRSTGVLNKIIGQVKTWRSLGNEVELVLISPPGKSKSANPQTESKIFSKTITRLLPQGFIRTYSNKIFSSIHVPNYIRLIKPDLIYYRQGIWYPGLLSVIKTSPTIMELNTDDISEIRLSGKLKSTIYMYGRDKIIKNVKGFVAVSNEIYDLYKQYNKPSCVVSNGFDFTNIPENTSCSNKRPQLLFVGSPDYQWQGVDKIFDMAKAITEADFHIVGYNFHFSIPSNIKVHGYLDKKKLYKLYNKIDFGIGSLALHRKNMHEASPLKVREYAAFGLPVVLGYYDTDLDGMDFILNIGNYQDNVLNNIEKIKNFINHWKGKRIDRPLMESLIGVNVKEKKRLEFLKSIL